MNVTHSFNAGLLEVQSREILTHTCGCGQQKLAVLEGKAAEHLHAAAWAVTIPAKQCPEEKSLGVMMAAI